MMQTVIEIILFIGIALILLNYFWGKKGKLNEKNKCKSTHNKL